MSTETESKDRSKEDTTDEAPAENVGKESDQHEMAKSLLLDCEERKELREKWVHEDDLINHRITWLFVSQTLLFAGYGLLLQVRSSNSLLPLEVSTKVDQLIELLPWVGFTTSLLIAIGVFGAGLALFILRRRNELNKGPRIDVHGFTSIMGWFSALGLPIVFLIIWLMLVWVKSPTPR